MVVYEAGDGTDPVEVKLSGQYWFNPPPSGQPMTPGLPMTLVQTSDPLSATCFSLAPGEARIFIAKWNLLADEGLGRMPGSATVQRVEFTAVVDEGENGLSAVSARRVSPSSELPMAPLPLDTLPFVTFRERLEFLSRDPDTGAIESRSPERVWASSDALNETRDLFFSFKREGGGGEKRLGLDQQFRADPIDPLPAHLDVDDDIQAVMPTDFDPERPDCLATVKGDLTYLKWDRTSGLPDLPQNLGRVQEVGVGSKRPADAARSFQLNDDLEGWLYWVYGYRSTEEKLDLGLTLVTARGADPSAQGTIKEVRTLVSGLRQDPGEPQLVAAHLKGDRGSLQLVFAVGPADGLSFRLVETTEGAQGLQVSNVTNLPGPGAITEGSVRRWFLRPWHDGAPNATSLVLVREVADDEATTAQKPIKQIRSDLLEFDAAAGSWGWRVLPEARFDLSTAPLPGASSSQRHLRLHAVHSDDLDAGLGAPGSDLTLVTNDTKFSVWVLSNGAATTPQWRRVLHADFDTPALRSTRFLDINGDHLLDFVTRDDNGLWEYYSSSLSGVAGSITALAGSADRPELFDLNGDDLWDLIAGTEVFVQQETGLVRSRKSEAIEEAAEGLQVTKALVEQVFIEEGRVHLVLWGPRGGTVVPVAAPPSDPAQDPEGEGFVIENERRVNFPEVPSGTLQEVWPWASSAIESTPASKDLIGLNNAGQLWHWKAAEMSFGLPEQANPDSQHLLEPSAGLALVRRGNLAPDEDRVRNRLAQDVVGVKQGGRGLVVFTAPDLRPEVLDDHALSLAPGELVVKIAAASLTEDRTDDLVLLIQRTSMIQGTSRLGVTYRLCAFEQQSTPAASQEAPEPFFTSAKERALWKLFAGENAEVRGFGFDYRAVANSEGFLLFEGDDPPTGVFFRRRVDGLQGTSFVRSPIVVSRKGAAFNFVMTDTDRDGQADVVGADDQMTVRVVDRGDRAGT
ncbi:MAG: hypothetical protein AAF628_03745 [Planctomycetota bacterium]